MSVEELVSRIDLGKIGIKLFLNEYGIDLYDKFKRLIDAHIENSLFLKIDRTIKLTNAGKLWKPNTVLRLVVYNFSN